MKRVAMAAVMSLKIVGLGISGLGIIGFGIIGFGGILPAVAQVPIVSPRYGAPPAPSAMTVRVLAVARPTVAYLDASSRLAVTLAGSPRLRTFARIESREQAAAGEALGAVAGVPAASADPLDAAAVAGSSIDEGADTILSGLPRFLRPPGARAIAADRAIATAAQADLAQLQGASTPATFDALFVDSQRDGLRRLVLVYRDYVQNGDDQDLRAIAVHELPRVLARLAALRG